MANIDDIAKMAGVSRSTVSRVLLGGDKVKLSTKEHVLKIIEEMNYSPNTAARALASRKTQNIGVVSSYTFNDPFYSIVGEEIYCTCEKLGYGTLFVINRANEPGHKDPIDVLNGKVDGFIYMGDHSVTKEQLHKLTKMGLPTAVFKTSDWVEGITRVDSDNVDGAYKGIEYLIGLGHRRIAVLCGSESSYENTERITGYQKALTDHGIAIESSLVFPGEFSYNVAMGKAKEILDTKATAVFCFNDVMAHGFIRGAMAAGCSVPEDISVLGYDDITFSNYDSYISLTTVKQPIKEMGRCLAETLIRRIEQGEPAECKIFPIKISEKETARHA